jgi:hypothetical protein
MPAKPGSHVAYARGSDVVVEWYDFGDHAPYESANLLVFARPAQYQLAEGLRATEDLAPHEIASRLAAHFKSYFEVKAFAEQHAIPFATETDFWP